MLIGRDGELSRLVGWVHDVATGAIKGYMRRGGINVVSVDDVAAGHVLAL